jgi:uncharacterized protein YerC
MTNVSKRPLKDKTQTKIEQIFTSFFADLSENEAKDFYTSFFTESEQIMFTKRLAIIVMLEKGAPYAHVARVLDVSASTVRRTDKRKEEGDLDGFITQLNANKNGFADRLWQSIRILIEENVHHYGASGWRWLDRINEEVGN